MSVSGNQYIYPIKMIEVDFKGNARPYRFSLILLSILLIGTIGGWPGLAEALDDTENPPPIINPEAERSSRHVVRGRDLRKIGDLQGSLYELNEALRIDPYNVEAYVERGLTRGKMEDYDSSYFDFDRALEIYPQHPQALYGRAEIHAKKNDLEGALNDYNEVIHLDPDNEDAYYRRGVLYYDRDQFKEAITDFTQLIRLNPRSYRAFSLRGLSKTRLADFDGAKADFDMALHINTRLYRTYYYRGNVKIIKGMVDEAVKDFDSAVQVNRRFAEVHMIRGLVRLCRENYEAALEDLEKTVVLKDDAPEALDYTQLWIWDARMNLGREAEAEAGLRAHLDHRLSEESEGGPEVSPWYTTLVNYHLGQIDEKTLMARAADANPVTEKEQLCEARYYRAQKYLLIDDMETANLLLKQCVESKLYQFFEYKGALVQLNYDPTDKSGWFSTIGN